MKKMLLLSGALLAALIAFLALNGTFGTGITGLAADSSQGFARSVQVGVVLLAAFGIFIITLLNVTHHEE